MHGVAAIVLRERRDPIGFVRGEVRERVSAACRLRVRHHRGGERAAVKCFALRRRNRLQCRGHGATREQFADARRAAARHEDVRPAQVLWQRRHRQCPFFRHHRRHMPTVARVADGGLEQVRERQLAEALGQRDPSGYGTGYRHRLPPAFRHGGTARESTRRPRHRGAARSIQADQFVPAPQDREQIRTDAVAAGLDHGERDGRGQRGIHCVAAARQHRETGLRRKRLRRRDGVAGKDRLAARRVGVRPVERHHSS